MCEGGSHGARDRNDKRLSVKKKKRYMWPQTGLRYKPAVGL